MSDDAVLTALKRVIDPELGINVVDLGLVRRAQQISGQIEVALAMTSPACPLGEVMVEEARCALEAAFPNASAIRVELVRDWEWTPKQMSQEGRRQLGLS